jgi:hypothetical protein
LNGIFPFWEGCQNLSFSLYRLQMYGEKMNAANNLKKKLSTLDVENC